MGITTKDLAAIAKGSAGPIREYIAAKITPLIERIEKLEARPTGLKYCGVWRSGQVYDAGDAVTHAGSLWICKATHYSTGTGIGHEHFQLAVKRGSDGKDAR